MVAAKRERQRIILSLVGRQGAGKSTIGKKLARYLSTKQIETSEVVMATTKTSYDKNKLTETGQRTLEDPNWLGKAVYKELLPLFNEEDKRSAVITGIRELEVHDYLKRRGLYVIGVDLVSDPDIRYERLFMLGKVNSAREFIDQEIKEQNLGLIEVMAQSQYEIPTSPQSDPDQLVRAIVSKITEKRKNLR